MARKRAVFSASLRKGVRAAGGASAYRSRMGYLPSGYHANPKKFASTLNVKQKARIRRMHSNVSAASFKRIYGFAKSTRRKR